MRVIEADNFNSIKVRLEQAFELAKQQYRKFQFHKGTIRTGLLLMTYSQKTYFNSIKVRLEH